MSIGEIVTVKVLRKSDIGYVLEDAFHSGKEYLMHFNDSTKSYNDQDEIEVFLFLDSQKRLSATDMMPCIAVDEAAFLTVVDYNAKLGFFLDNHIKKQVLLSVDDLPLKESWPHIGDKVLVRLKASKAGLFAKRIQKEDINNYLEKTADLEVGQTYQAHVIKAGKEGYNLVTDTYNHIFVYKLHTRRSYRIGEVVDVKIIKAENDCYNGTLILQKELMIESDTDIVLSYLKMHNNEMPFDIKSDAQDVYKTFNMSKNAFKIALSNLYKKRMIEFKEGKTFLIKEV